MTLQSLQLLELMSFLSKHPKPSNSGIRSVVLCYFNDGAGGKVTHRVNLPYDDCCVFGPRGQFGAIVGEFAEPYFIAVLCQDLLGVAGELFPGDNSQCILEMAVWRVGASISLCNFELAFIQEPTLGYTDKPEE